MNQIERRNYYAVRAVKAFMDGDSVRINEQEYIYQDGEILVKASRTEDGVESEIWLGGMCSEISLEHFLIYCASKTMADQIRDFSFKLPSRGRNA